MVILDLCCNCGGITKGLMNAGHTVHGVDLFPQPDYCGHEFFQMDVIEAINDLNAGSTLYDIVFASPPCQNYSYAAKRWNNAGAKRVDLVADVRTALEKKDLPYVIENVVQAPLIKEKSILVSGFQLGLIPRYHKDGVARDKNGRSYIPGVIKQRRFESNMRIKPPEKTFPVSLSGNTKGSIKNGDYVTLAGHGGNNPQGMNRLSVWEQASEITWLQNGNASEKKHNIAEAIPPRYSRYIIENMEI